MLAPITTLAFSESEMGIMIPIIAIVGGLGIGAISIVCKTIQRSIAVRHKEESRREIAAYVAEGTMSPDDAFKILNAGSQDKGKGGCC